jgi:UDP-glucose 4-epimerase
MSKLILCTGGAGFVGSNLCRRLVKDGHRVIVLDNYFTGTKSNHVEGVDYRKGSNTDIATLVPETPDLIYHLGEYPRIETSLREPALVWKMNVAGTFSVIEYWREKKCKLVYAGSSTKFADGGMGRNLAPYTWMKATNSELIRNYATWYDLPYAITYFYSVYGPGERAAPYGTVIEIFKQKRLANEPICVVTPGTQKRNFTHVDDIIDGLVLVGEKGVGDEFGIGSDEAYSILEVAQMFGGEIVMLPELQGNRMDSSVDTTKTRLLGWKSTRHLPDYIKPFAL